MKSEKHQVLHVEILTDLLTHLRAGGPTRIIPLPCGKVLQAAGFDPVSLQEELRSKRPDVLAKNLVEMQLEDNGEPMADVDDGPDPVADLVGGDAEPAGDGADGRAGGGVCEVGDRPGRQDAQAQPEPDQPEPEEVSNVVVLDPADSGVDHIHVDSGHVTEDVDAGTNDVLEPVVGVSGDAVSGDVSAESAHEDVLAEEQHVEATGEQEVQGGERVETPDDAGAVENPVATSNEDEQRVADEEADEVDQTPPEREEEPVNEPAPEPVEPAVPEPTPQIAVTEIGLPPTIVKALEDAGLELVSDLEQMDLTLIPGVNEKQAGLIKSAIDRTKG